MLDKSLESFSLQLEGLLEPLVFWNLVKIRQRLPPRLARARDKLWDVGDPAKEVVHLIQQFVDSHPEIRKFWVNNFYIPTYEDRIVTFVSEILADQKGWCPLIAENTLGDIGNTGIVLMLDDIVALIAIDLADRYPETRDRSVRKK